MRLLTRLFVLMLSLGMLMGGCMSVQTGSGSQEQRTDAAENHASDLRAQWAREFDGVEPMAMIPLFLHHVDVTTDRFSNYAAQVADQWSDGNKGRGAEIPASEMRESVTQWTASEQPVLLAYDDMLEFGYEQIKLSQHFDEQSLGLVKQLVDTYYDLSSAVFFPSGLVDDYRYQTGNLRSRVLGLIAEVQTDMSRY